MDGAGGRGLHRAQRLDGIGTVQRERHLDRIELHAAIIAALGDRTRPETDRPWARRPCAWRQRRTPPAIEATTASWIVPPKRSRTMRSSSRGSVTVLNARCWPPLDCSGRASRPRRTVACSSAEPAWRPRWPPHATACGPRSRPRAEPASGAWRGCRRPSPQAGHRREPGEAASAVPPGMAGRRRARSRDPRPRLAPRVRRRSWPGGQTARPRAPQ